MFILDKECLLCASCLEVCPLFQATHREEYSPRAKGFLLQELSQSAGHLSEQEVRKLVGICLSCGRCSGVCPQNIDLPRIISDFKSRDPGWKSWIWGRIIKGLPLIFPVLEKCGGAVSLVLPQDSLAANIASASQVRPWLKVLPQKNQQSGLEKEIAIFPGCIAGYAKKSRLQKAEELICLAGYNLLEQPDWKCCGFSMGQSGLRQEQQEMQQENLALWRSKGKPVLAVFCATCRFALLQMTEYDLGWEAGEKEEWKQSILSVCALAQGKIELQLNPQDSPKSLILHKPCHLRETDNFWLGEALKAQGLIVHLADACCGLGGSMLLENSSLTDLVGRKFWEEDYVSGAQQLLTACNGCEIQLNRLKPEDIAVAHWLDIIYA